MTPSPRAAPVETVKPEPVKAEPVKKPEPEKKPLWFVWGKADFLTYYDRVEADTAERAAEGMMDEHAVNTVRVWPLREEDCEVFDVERTAELKART